MIDDKPAFVRGVVQVKKVSALANRNSGILDSQIVDAITWICDEILEDGRCFDQLPINAFQGGTGTSVNMNTNRVVMNLALEHLGYAKGRYTYVHPNDHVNKFQLANNAYPTGSRPRIYEKVEALIVKLERLIDSLTSKGLQFKDALKMGRTQL